MVDSTGMKTVFTKIGNVIYNSLKLKDMERKFIRTRSVKDITISTGLTVTGCILVALPTATSINITGFFLIFTGLILALIMKTGYKDEESGVRYCKKERFFSQDKRESLINAITANPEKVDLTGEDQGNALRIDIYHSDKEGKAYVQLFKYVPYKYEPCSRMHELELDKAHRLIGR